MSQNRTGDALGFCNGTNTVPMQSHATGRDSLPVGESPSPAALRSGRKLIRTSPRPSPSANAAGQQFDIDGAPNAEPTPAPSEAVLTNKKETKP